MYTSFSLNAGIESHNRHGAGAKGTFPELLSHRKPEAAEAFQITSRCTWRGRGVSKYLVASRAKSFNLSPNELTTYLGDNYLQSPLPF